MSPIQTATFSGASNAEASGRRVRPERCDWAAGRVSAIGVSRSASSDGSTAPPPRRHLWPTDVDAGDSAVS
jgi:hypothetical protein